MLAVLVSGMLPAYGTGLGGVESAGEAAAAPADRWARLQAPQAPEAPQDAAGTPPPSEPLVAAGTATAAAAPPANRWVRQGWRKDWKEGPEWGGRLGYVDAAGDLWVRMQRIPQAPWVLVARDVEDFQLMDWRLAVRKRDGSLWYAQGALNEPLRQIDERVAAYQLTLTRAGVLREDGTLRLHASPGSQLTAAETVATGVRAFQVTDDRLAMLDVGGQLRMQQGATFHPDTVAKIADDVRAFQLEREWVAYRQSPGNLMLAKGELWDGLEFREVQAAGLEDFEIEVSVEFTEGFPSRLHLAAVDHRGQLLYAEGAEPGPAMTPFPVATSTPAKAVHWAGEQLAVVGHDGALQVAELESTALAPGFLVKALGAWTDAGVASEWRLNVERSLLLSRAEGELSIMGPKLGPPEPTTEGPERSQVLGVDTATEVEVLSADLVRAGTDRSKTSSDGDDTSFGIASFDQSSLRPWFTRRPVALSDEQAADVRAATPAVTEPAIAEEEDTSEHDVANAENVPTSFSTSGPAAGNPSQLPVSDTAQPIPQTPDPAMKGSGGSIYGTVGVGGVSILAASSSAKYSTTSAPGGFYQFDLPSGAYEITPSRAHPAGTQGYLFSPASQTVWLPEGGKVTVNFAATAVYTIDGVVWPHIGATVTASGPVVRSTQSIQLGTVIGVYGLWDLPAGTYTVTPAKAGYVFEPPSRTVVLPPNGQFVDFFEVSSISGSVGSSGATVTASVPNANPWTTTTNSSGNYTLKVSSYSTYTVKVTKPGYTFLPASRSVTVPPSATGVNFSRVLRTVSGNVGIGGATVTAGSQSATSASNGAFTINGLNTTTYTVAVVKSGCSFTPSSKSVNLASANATGVDFYTHCGLNHPRGVTSYADGYIRNYPYGTRGISYGITHLLPTGSRITNPACAPPFPNYKVYPGATQPILTHQYYMPIGGNGVSTLQLGQAGFFFCHTGFGQPCGNWPCSAGVPVCSIVHYTDHIEIRDNIAAPAAGLPQYYCAADGKYYLFRVTGPSHRHVYIGEIKPDYWGSVPRAAISAGNINPGWQILVKTGRVLVQNTSTAPAAHRRDGDGYWVNVVNIAKEKLPLMGGGDDGPGCLAGNTACFPLSGRVTVSRINGKYVVTISGYLSDDDLVQNTIDVAADLGNLAGLGTLNSHVRAVAQWFADSPASVRENAILVGHSLGALDAVTLYQMGLGRQLVTYSPPFVIPANSLLPRSSPYFSGSRPVIHFGGINDPINGYYRLNQLRRAGGVNIFDSNTGNAIFSFDNPHDRGLYCVAAPLGSRYCF